MTALPHPGLTRRELLKAGGALIVSFAIGAGRPAQAFDAPLLGNAADIGKPLALDEVASFLAVHEDGSVTVFTGKVDLGTGLRIAIRQMVAEELDLPVVRIALVEGDTALTPDQGPTGGSSGITRGGVPIRQAAATARAALLKLAAAKFGVPVNELIIADGEARMVSGGGRFNFGQILEGRRLALKVDAKAPLKAPPTYRVVGQALPRPDLPAKCTGRHVYVHDFSVPGMLHGRPIRPPAVGARLVSLDEASLAGIPGARAVRIKDFLGVVAEDEWAAIRAAKALKASWSQGQGLPGSEGLEQHVRASAVDHDETVAKRGDPAAALPRAERRLAARYFWPVQSHASMGPSCAVADVAADRATIWTASQATHKYRSAFARILALPEDKVRLIYLDGAGCYGMNGHDDAAADAALLSRAVGKPVRVQWMREDEHGWDPKGPPQLIELEASLDAKGAIAAWRTEMWLPAATKGMPNVPLLAPEAAGIKQELGLFAGLIGQNGDPPYAVADMEAVVHWLKETPLRPSNIRAPGKIANSFAVEGFTDELAAEARRDPLEFRLSALSDPRGIVVLKRAAELFGWTPRPSPNPERAAGKPAIGRGLAYVHYKHNENYVAIAMEVAVEPGMGEVRVRRVACAHDCGLVINPDALKNQIEGCILQTLSRTLHEEVTFDRARVTSVDWASYPILTFPEVPAVEIALLDRPELPPFGAGEAATTPVPGALANAIFDATGARLRTAPITAERVKAALLGH
ncbi:MAG TPA: molybdopterin cofactor-binding domain-containing protein [Alphaproteobacteria bacterium]|nr:molybdopterin cofactor-binding domain-containing protein [Alphaproteobacteria bacterium]